MSARPLIVMALPSESGGLIEARGFNVVYTGLGKVNAAHGLTRALHQARAEPISYVLNLGSVGSQKHPRGALVEVDRFVQRDMDVMGLGFPLGHTPFEAAPATLTIAPRFAHLPTAVCGTGDSFLQGPSPLECCVVDMEAYALAKVCHLESVPFACVKYVTDGADDAAAGDWQTNIADAPHAFATLLAHAHP
jgi:adenosylhomocysteine nucleosidase